MTAQALHDPFPAWLEEWEAAILAADNNSDISDKQLSACITQMTL